MSSVLEGIKEHKTMLLRSVGVVLWAWLCYIPDVQLDLEHTYVESGVLSEKNSRRGTTTKFNNRVLCINVYMLGCRTTIKGSGELRRVLTHKVPVEVVFARDMGNAVGAIFLNRSFAIEIRLNGKPLPYCSQGEMLSNVSQPSLISLLFSVFWFLFGFPLIFNINFYHNLVRK